MKALSALLETVGDQAMAMRMDIITGHKYIYNWLGNIKDHQAAIWETYSKVLLISLKGTFLLLLHLIVQQETEQP